MKTIFLFLAIFAHSAKADWFCTDEASERHGNVIRACGLAHNPDESIARGDAYANASAEFSRICNSSHDCRSHSVETAPVRTECNRLKGVYYCARLVEFTIDDSIPEEDHVITLECHPGCNSHDQSGCWMPGSMWAWNRGCTETKDRPFKK